MHCEFTIFLLNPTHMGTFVLSLIFIVFWGARWLEGRGWFFLVDVYD